MIGTSVTKYSLLYVFGTSTVEVRKLERCSRLSDLELYLEPGALHGLRDVAPSISALRRLKLHWASYRHKGGVLEEPGVMLDIAKALPKLESLYLWHFNVRTGEWISILEHVGIRLRELEISSDFTWKGNLQVEQVESIMLAILKFNPSIRRLEVHQYNRAKSIASDKDDSWRACRANHSLTGLMYHMKRRLPYLDPVPFEESISLLMYRRGRKRRRLEFE